MLAPEPGDAQVLAADDPRELEQALVRLGLERDALGALTQDLPAAGSAGAELGVTLEAGGVAWTVRPRPEGGFLVRRSLVPPQEAGPGLRRIGPAHASAADALALLRAAAENAGEVLERRGGHRYEAVGTRVRGGVSRRTVQALELREEGGAWCIFSSPRRECPPEAGG